MCICRTPVPSDLSSWFVLHSCVDQLSNAKKDRDKVVVSKLGCEVLTWETLREKTTPFPSLYWE